MTTVDSVVGKPAVDKQETGEPKLDDLGKRGRGTPYDNAVKMLEERERVLMCRWMGASMSPRSRKTGEDLRANPLRVDYLMHSGKLQLTHVEFERKSSRDLGGGCSVIWAECRS
jgi:hypothetical protein